MHPLSRLLRFADAPSAQNNQQGLYTFAAPIHVSNVILVCPKCRQTTRVGNTDLADGTKVRTCRKCGEVLDR